MLDLIQLEAHKWKRSQRIVNVSGISQVDGTIWILRYPRIYKIIFYFNESQRATKIHPRNNKKRYCFQVRLVIVLIYLFIIDEYIFIVHLDYISETKCKN